MKPTQATLRQRLDEIYAIRVDGATIHDVRRYVAEKETAKEPPWTIPKGGRPVSERTLWRYIQQTDRMMDEVSRESRARRLRRHLAKRRNLYAKAVLQGDIKAALAVLRDEADMLGLYDPPPPKPPAADNPLSAPADVVKLLADLIQEARHGKMNPKQAAALGQLGAGLLRGMETADLEARLRALEEEREARKVRR